MSSERLEKLLTPTSRQQLWGPDKPFYWAIRRCRYVGYRRRETDRYGKWWAMVITADRRQKQKVLGVADDDLPADGVMTFNFNQAAARAEQWFLNFEGKLAPDRREFENPVLFPEVLDAPPYTVGNAAQDYINWYRIHRRGLYTVYNLIKNHVLPTLGAIPLEELDPPMLQRWFDNLIEMPPIISSSRFTGKRYGARQTDPEFIRKRKNTANCHLTYLKALLNRAYEHGFVSSDWAWVHVKRFKNVSRSTRVRYLEKDEIRALVDAARPDVAAVIKGGLMTGCRVGDLHAMKVGDYVKPVDRIVVYARKTSNLHHIALSREGSLFFKQHTKGRSDDDMMFVMQNGDPWTPAHFRKHFCQAQEKSGINPPATFHMLRHTYASHGVMAGIPLKVIANQLGHTTTRMVDQHYAHLAEDFLEEVVRERMPRLLTSDD